MDGFSIREKEQQAMADINRIENAQRQDQAQQPLQQIPAQAQAQDQAQQPLQQADPMRAQIPAQPIRNDALRQMNPVAAQKNDFELIQTKEEVIAQMEKDMSLGTSLLVGKVTKKRLKEARKQFRDKYNAKVYQRHNVLVEEVKAYIAQNNVFAERDRELKARIEVIEEEKRQTQVLDKAKTEELQELQLEAEYVEKYKKQNSRVLNHKRGTETLLKQELRLRHLIAHYREKLEREKVKGNSSLMNAVIEKVEAFDNLVNSPKFDIAKQYSYIHEFIEMRNAVAMYHNKNKGYKFFEKGEYRRDLTANFLKHMTNWIADLPAPVQDTFLEEMEKPEYEKIRSFESSDQMYQTLGEKAFQKKIPAQRNRRVKAADYVTPLTIRLMSAHRCRQREMAYAQDYDLTPMEIQQVLDGEENKNPEITVQDDRCWGYTFGGLKRNYDGTPVDDEKERKIREGVLAWRHNDVEKMKPFLDQMIEKITNFKLKLADFLPENLKKNGPSLIRQQELIFSIQNIFAPGTIGEAYLKTKSPALKAKIEMVKTLSPYVSLLDCLCNNMNISTEQGKLGRVRDFAVWFKPSKGKKTEALIRKWIERPESVLNMEFGFSLAAQEREVDRIPEPERPEKFRKKYRLDRDLVDETKELIIPAENTYLSSMAAMVSDEVQKGDYFSEDNKQYRKIRTAKELRALLDESKEEEDQILEVYHQIEAKEEERSGCAEVDQERIQAELEKLHKQKDDFIRYVKTAREAKKEKMADYPEAQNRFLTRYYEYQNRDTDLADKFRVKLTKDADRVSCVAFYTDTNCQMNMVKKAECEKKMEQDGISEEKKAAYMNLADLESVLIQMRKDCAYIGAQLEAESAGANNLISERFHEEESAGIPRQQRTSVANSLIGSAFRDRIPTLLTSALDKQKEIADLEKQTRAILWKQIYHFSGIKNPAGNFIPQEKAEQMLNIMNEYLREQSYLASLKTERTDFETATNCFSVHADALGLPQAFARIDQAVEEQYVRMERLKNQMLDVCAEEFPQLGQADFREVMETIKSQIYIETEQGETTLKAMEKDEFVEERMFAMRAAGKPRAQMSREGAELAYRRLHLFGGEEDELFTRYVAPGSQEDRQLRRKFKSEYMDRVVIAGLHYIRYDDKQRIYPEDVQKDAWNRRWLQACLSDDYENEVRPMLQDMLDELLKATEVSYTDRLNMDLQLGTDEQFQGFMRLKRIALTFQSNICKDPAFSRFKEEYLHGTQEQRIKWKKLDNYTKLWAALNNVVTNRIEGRYFLHEKLSGPADTVGEAESKVASYFAGAQLAVYPCETMKHTKYKLYVPDPADVYMRMAQLPKFDITKIEQYEEFFKFYAQVDDLDAQIADANAQIAEIDRALAQDGNKEELEAKKATLQTEIAEHTKARTELLKDEKAMVARANGGAV